MVIQAEGLLLKDADKLKNSEPYRFDVIDVQRQMMTNMGQVIHKRAAEAFLNRDKEAFALHSKRFLQMLEDVDELLRTRPEFNFDRWLTSARSWGDTEEEKNLLEYDATSLVTIWGQTEILLFLTTHGENGRDLLRVLFAALDEVLCHASGTSR